MAIWREALVFDPTIFKTVKRTMSITAVNLLGRFIPINAKYALIATRANASFITSDSHVATLVTVPPAGPKALAKK